MRSCVSARHAGSGQWCLYDQFNKCVASVVTYALGMANGGHEQGPLFTGMVQEVVEGCEVVYWCREVYLKCKNTAHTYLMNLIRICLLGVCENGRKNSSLEF